MEKKKVVLDAKIEAVELTSFVREAFLAMQKIDIYSLPKKTSLTPSMINTQPTVTTTPKPNMRRGMKVDDYEEEEEPVMPAPSQKKGQQTQQKKQEEKYDIDEQKCGDVADMIIRKIVINRGEKMNQTQTYNLNSYRAEFLQTLVNNPPEIYNKILICLTSINTI